MPRLRIILKPVGRGHEVVGFIPAGVSYETPTAPLARRILDAARRFLKGPA